MAHVTRRSFLKSTSAGAVALGALGAAPTLAGAAGERTARAMQATPASATTPAGATASAPSASFAVYVSNSATGELTIMAGDREVVYTDAELVARLWQAMG